MMNDKPLIPVASYGILTRDESTSNEEIAIEQVRRLGYAILDSDFSAADLERFSAVFDQTRTQYVKSHGEARLRAADELHTIRAPLTAGSSVFIQLATHPKLLAVLEKLIAGKFILNQQNGIINPPGQTYNQGAWHRDLPYQHYVSSTPLAVNALFCVDDFTFENGSTFVLPATHKVPNYPSQEYIQRNALQVEAKAGQYILLDCMLFHSGGFNQTRKDRRAVNHVYTIPYFKQQIRLPDLMSHLDLSDSQKEIFGFRFTEPLSIERYITNKLDQSGGKK